MRRLGTFAFVASGSVLDMVDFGGRNKSLGFVRPSDGGKGSRSHLWLGHQLLVRFGGL